ncbi:alpha/beta hydrolase [Leptospira adleri]|uniref:Alpha/beta hydrolase n=2 Tax=Leptospira adleri TaxID=2023186 RepID=A0A2M9YJT5_9LEPT|nr:alpha/beta hydrolase [Leptospira adleri]PJZ51805.1 alpha/beta hydrolase [Leptospira adleri]PJZ62294.1 alpha/beta hydrolase [Leptospira adleri]
MKLRTQIFTIFWIGLAMIVCSGGQEMQTAATEKSTIQSEEKPSGIFQSRQGSIAYWIRGKGETLILLHSAGPGHDHRDFDAVVPKLSESFRVISVDWPGHGSSGFPNPVDSASAVSYADILPELVELLAPKGAVLIGNSLGGYASMRIALDKPNLVKGLILVDTGGMNDPDFKTRMFVKLMSSLWFTGATWNAFPNYYIKVENPYTKSILTRIEERKRVEGSKNVRAAIWKSFSDERHDLREKVAKITAPTLIVWGEMDPVIVPELGERLHDKIKGSRLVFLKTGHVPFAEDPEGFLEAAIPFLKSIR